MPVPAIRLAQANEVPIRRSGQYVLYWMTAQRRTRYNFALQHAVDRAKELGKPLLIFEPLRARYRWSSDRLHRFVIEGMRDNAAALEKSPATYFPYVEPTPGSAGPLLHTLARDACTVVTDEYPCFFLPKMVAAVKARLPARLELVDSNGVVPLRLPDRTFTVAHSYRRWMQKNILEVLLDGPKPHPLARVRLPRLSGLPAKILRRWSPADFGHLLDRNGIQSIPIDHDVRPWAGATGGSKQAAKRWRAFLAQSFASYAEDRNHPECHVTTGLSPYLHFGHISAHQVVSDLLDDQGWTPGQTGPVNGKNHGFWNLDPSGEALIDQVLTWREMGFNLSHRQGDRYDKYESLPAWALKTLGEHASDPRPFVYSLGEFENAETHDELWNAAQRELTTTGVMQNYLRMLWGKKILHWTSTPQEALSVMIHLNNKYGLDGRDPNSYSGIFWVLGRYDRAWGPKRPVFGSVRYMTSDSARKKLRLGDYLARFGPRDRRG